LSPHIERNFLPILGRKSCPYGDNWEVFLDIFDYADYADYTVWYYIYGYGFYLNDETTNINRQ